MSIRAAMENPEPIEPTMVSVPGGLYCIVHGVMDCTLPFCWRCGNHKMDDFDRCADPRCRATCSPEAMAVVERTKSEWSSGNRPGPVPLEVVAFVLAWEYVMTRDKDGRPFIGVTSIPSLPGEPGGGDVPEPSVPATGAPE